MGGERDNPEVVRKVDKVDETGKKVVASHFKPDDHLPGVTPITDQKVDGIVNGVRLTDNGAVVTTANDISTKAGGAFGFPVSPGHPDFTKYASGQIASRQALLGAIQGAPNREALGPLAQQVHTCAAEAGHAGELLASLHVKLAALREQVQGSDKTLTT
jgi:hypothetical protein